MNTERSAVAIAALALAKGLDYAHRMLETIVSQPTQGRPTAEEIERLVDASKVNRDIAIVNIVRNDAGDVLGYRLQDGTPLKPVRSKSA